MPFITVCKFVAKRTSLHVKMSFLHIVLLYLVYVLTNAVKLVFLFCYITIYSYKKIVKILSLFLESILRYCSHPMLIIKNYNFDKGVPNCFDNSSFIVSTYFDSFSILSSVILLIGAEILKAYLPLLL